MENYQWKGGHNEIRGILGLKNTEQEKKKKQTEALMLTLILWVSNGQNSEGRINIFGQQFLFGGEQKGMGKGIFSFLF